MNIAIYSRKSKYSEKGESIDNQIQFCKDYAEIHLSHIPDKEYYIYEDEGFSAATTARPQFQKLLKDIKNRNIHILMCYRLDRINRNVSDFSKTLDLLEQSDISFISATENFDTATPMGKAMIYIASVFAQLERETTAERIRDNMLALARTGRWLGGLTPLGYQSEAILYMDEEYKERQLYKLVPVHEELVIVKLLFNKYIETKSLSQVESYCLANHIKTQKKCDFTKSTIALVIQNPTYCIADTQAYEYFNSLECSIANAPGDFDGKHGILCYNRTMHQSGRKQKKRPSKEWILAIGKHEGIIDGKEFIYVQNLIKQNKSKGNPRAETSNIALFSGKITCSDCGSKLRIKNVQRNGSKINFSYACEMKVLSKGSRCHIPNIPGIKFDAIIFEIIKELLSTGIQDTCYIPYLKLKENLIRGMEQDGIEKIQFLKTEQNIINNTIHNLMSRLMQTDSPVMIKYLKPQLEELDQNLIRIQTEIELLSSIGKENQIHADIIQSLYNNFINAKALLDNSDIVQKKFLMKTLIHNIAWDGHTAFITFESNKGKNEQHFSKDR